MEEKFVWKFGTGHPIPSTAKYLCTQVETLEKKELEGTAKWNRLVWHYYEVDAETAKNWKQ